MRVLASLVSKEWREERWKAAFGAAFLGGMAAIGLQGRIVQDELVLITVTMLGALPLSGFVAIGLLARERAERTLETLLALPVSPWAILSAKTAVGAAVTAIPLLAALAVSLLAAGGREVSGARIAEIYLSGIALAWTVLLWTLALSSRARSEARAGVIFIGIIFLWQAGSMLLFHWLPEGGWEGLHPFGIVLLHSSGPLDRAPRGEAIATQLGIAACLWLSAGAHFARFERRSSRA